MVVDDLSSLLVNSCQASVQVLGPYKSQPEQPDNVSFHQDQLPKPSDFAPI